VARIGADTGERTYLRLLVRIGICHVEKGYRKCGSQSWGEDRPVPSLRISLAPNFFKSTIAHSFHQRSTNIHIYKMMSLKSFSRALPRSLLRQSARCQPRTLASVPRTSILQHTLKATSIPRYAAFSTSRAVREKEGQGTRTL